MLLFQLGSDRFSLPAVAARGVQPLNRYTILPATPPWIIGLVNVRGRLLTAIDLRPLLMIAPMPPRPDSFLLIVSADGTDFGLLADLVIAVDRSNTQLASQPTNAPGRAVAWIRGIDSALGIRLDPALLLADPRLLVNDTTERTQKH